MRSIFYLLTALLIFITSSLELSAQAYIPIVKGDTAFYLENSYKLDYPPYFGRLIFATRTDSIRKEKGISYYIINRTWDDSDYNCIKPEGNSWLGPYFTIDSTGGCFFFNKDKDTIKLILNANEGDKWRLYNFKDGRYIEASVAKISFDSFLGLNDSVKHIVLKSHTAAGKDTANILNGKTIEISRNNGFVRTLFLNKFPDDSTSMIIFGKTNPPAGKTFMQPKDIYDFDIGDEFHYDSCNSSQMHGFVSCTDQIRKVTGKSFSVSRDTVYYTFHVWSNTFYRDLFKDDTSETISEYDEIMFYPLKPFKYLPYEPIIDTSDIQGWDYNGKEYSMSLPDSINNRRLFTPPYWRFLKKEEDSCWYAPSIDGPTIIKYMDGCGLYYLDATGGWIDGERIWLVYYKKGTETWGKPITIVSVNESVREESQGIYPNPATGYLYIKDTKTGVVQIYTPQGVKVLETENTGEVDVGNLDQGVYFLRLNGRVYKFVKLNSD